MNVKPGDIAVIVRQPRQEPRGLGAFVEVLRAGRPACYARYGLTGPQVCWWVKSSTPLETDRHGACTEFVVPDAFLRPIRDNDGTDETLEWTTRPSDIETLYEALESMRGAE